MNNTAIRVENLGKLYRIGSARERNKTLREAITDMVTAPLRSMKKAFREPPAPKEESDDHIWALKNVSFEVKRGEVVGIIGRNGAGKSTLLKILSRITEPTEGRIVMRGRVGSLLEVGTGFHSELTGEENIYLSGTILGMSSREISNKFDEIVSFAEMGKFIHTPVKHYSSGMYMRLAFAVAAHLEPEILLIDEVLAVGDAEFQKKCLGRMEEVGKEGRTVLFVSHNMQAIRQLCSRGILLNNGKIVVDGDVISVTEQYLQNTRRLDDAASLSRIIADLPPDPAFKLEEVSFSQDGKSVWGDIENGKPFEIRIVYQVLQRTVGLRVFFDVCDTQETLLFRSFHDEIATGISVMEAGHYESRSVIPADLLGSIAYEIRIQAGIFNVRYCIPESTIRVLFQVTATGNYNKAYLGDTFRGKLAPVIKWETDNEPAEKVSNTCCKFC